MPCLEGGLHRLKADPSARADDEDRRHGFMLHGRTRLAHHHVRCRQPHRKIGERLADKAAHALPASGAAGAPAATRAPAATGAHRSSQRATGANASLDPLEFWSVGRQPRLTASAISSGWPLFGSERSERTSQEEPQEPQQKSQEESQEL